MDHMAVAARNKETLRPRKIEIVYAKSCEMICANRWERQFSRKQIEIIIELWLAGLGGVPIALAQLNEKLTRPYRSRRWEFSLYYAVTCIIPTIAQFLPMYRIEQCGEDDIRTYMLVRRETAAPRVRWDIKKCEDGRQVIYPCG
jgi:hypothetical protein